MENKELEKVTQSNNVLVIGGKERIIRFGFSAWAKLEEKYGSIQNIEKLETEMEKKPITELRELAWIGLQDKEVYNEQGKRTGKQLDKETFLDEYSMADIQKVTEIVMGALYGALPKNEKEDNKEGEV